MRVLGQIDASSGKVTRQIPYTVTYTKATQEMVIEAQGTKAPGCEDCMLKCTANRQGMTLQFGRGDAVYEISAAGQVEEQGKTLRMQFDWKEVTIVTKTRSLALTRGRIKGRLVYLAKPKSGAPMKY